ncbi:hypothetical protein VTK56DRAFT_8580 [Thermocarpiscus australiensis]
MRFAKTVLAAAAAIRESSTITVDLSRTFQRMDGFGFSLAFQRANLITNMSDKVKQRELLDLLFNRTTGAGVTILRNGIGPSLNSDSDFMNTTSRWKFEFRVGGCKIHYDVLYFAWCLTEELLCI